MTTKVYTTGYGGRKAGAIKGLAERYGAVVFDIRFSPRSRNPAWSRKQMSARLQERYVHVKAFGNANFKGGPIRIVDYEAGKKLIEQSKKPVILVCVCKDAKICHRTTIAHRLRADGFDVSEIGQQMRQSTMFTGPVLGVS